MVRGLIAITAAISVFWHTVGGCAHHAYTPMIAGLAASMSAACCEDAGYHAEAHQHTHHDRDQHREESQGRRPADATSQQIDNEYPCDGPSRCTEGCCDFAAPKSPNSVESYESVCNGWLPSPSGFDGALETPSPRGARPFAYRASFPVGALRPHLALGVMLL